MNYNQSLEYINSFTVSGNPVNNLDRILRLLNSVGNPQKNLKFIHIAGTNGKGSVLEMISAGLIASGKKTGQLTSPFVKHYRDRIRINGNDIPMDRVCFFANKIKKAAPLPECSQFEITLAVALLHFSSENCDIVCMEAGLGGLLDATNFVENPLVSVIMSISLDHMSVLGSYEEEIAIQKAGIIKQDCPCVLYSKNSPSVTQILIDTAKNLNSQYIIPSESQLDIKKISQNGSIIEYQNIEYQISMAGEHQIFNALTAIETMQVLKIDNKYIRSGIAMAKVFARLQHISKNIYFDGAHNLGGAKALAQAIPLIDKNIIGICGMMQAKDYKSCVTAISKSLKSVICIDDFSANSVSANILAKKFTDQGTDAYVCKTFGEALCFAENLAGKGSIIIFGSLYMYEKLCEILADE